MPWSLIHTLFPYTTLFRSGFTKDRRRLNNGDLKQVKGFTRDGDIRLGNGWVIPKDFGHLTHGYCLTSYSAQRSEEHTSELQSHSDLVCRLLLEKNKTNIDH